VLSELFSVCVILFHIVSVLESVYSGRFDSEAVWLWAKRIHLSKLRVIDVFLISVEFWKLH